MSINECREIYREAFGTDEDFENRLFSACADYCKELCINGKTVSMLFALPCNIYNGGGLIPAYYIFAAATKKEFRGKGYMTQLINSLETDRLLFLKPANAPLFKFYEKLGFKRFEISADENSRFMPSRQAALQGLHFRKSPYPPIAPRFISTKKPPI